MQVMMQFGLLQFSLATAAYQSLLRSSEYRWARIPRVGAADALQFTGIGNETIELAGVIYPDFMGGVAEVDKMRTQASLGIPLPMVSGAGRVLGLWVCTAVSETQEVFWANGAPRRVDFSMSVARYDGGLRSILPF